MENGLRMTMHWHCTLVLMALWVCPDYERSYGGPVENGGWQGHRFP